jgi:hypothetical protein
VASYLNVNVVDADEPEPLLGVKDALSLTLSL